MQSRSSQDEVAGQQLVRYEALFKLLEDLRSLDDASAIAKLCAARWKYFANGGAWRLVVDCDDGFQVIDARRGTASVSQASALEDWDRHHWQAGHPCVLAPEEWQGIPGLPEHLASADVVQLLVLPVLSNGRAIGLLSSSARHEPFTELDKKFIRLLSAHLTDQLMATRLRQRAMDLLVSKASHDALTGALNRGAIMDRLQTQLALAQRTRVPLTVMIVDVDFFKRVNDTHGHPAGDDVLRELARRFKAMCRASESFGRYGGEEFLFVLYPCSARDGVTAGNRIREGIAARPFTIDVLAGLELAVTVSLGAACSDDLTNVTAEALISRADQALYQSKAGGRNRVTMAPPDLPVAADSDDEPVLLMPAMEGAAPAAA